MEQNSDDLQHTLVSGDPGSARGLWPLLMSGMSARYLFDGSSELVKNFQPERAKRLAAAAIEPLRAYVVDQAADEVSRAAALKAYGKLNPALSKEEAAFKLDALRESYVAAVAAGDKAGDWARKTAEDTLGLTEPPSRISVLEMENAESLAFKATTLKDKFQGTMDAFAKSALDRRADYLYDIPLGFGSAAITTVYASHVAKNMDNLFAEAVGYENGKDPRSVSLNDLRHSDNRIVADTWHNYEKKNALRYATDAVFAGRLLEHLPGLEKAGSIPFGKFGIAGKAMMLFSEIFRHQKTTMFEDLVTLVDKKLNPERGIGQPITAADMAGLFQKYTLGGNHSNADISVNWVRAAPMFEEMAKAMNASYQDKYSQMGTGQKADGPDFILPKLIYLLGHDLIDPNKPEQTLAFVRAASEEGIAAVKALEENIKQGLPLGGRESAPPFIDVPFPAARPIARDAVLPDTRVNDRAAVVRFQENARALS